MKRVPHAPHTQCCSSDGMRALVREEVRALLARLLADEPAPYTTHRDGPRPEGIRLRSWQRLAPTIPGAVRRGRYLIVSRAAFEAWERGQAAVAPTAPANDLEAEWTAAGALASIGLRSSR
jgi:hypothetical protein